MRVLYQLEHSIRLVYSRGKVVGRLNKLCCIIWQDCQSPDCVHHGNLRLCHLVKS